MDMTLSDKGALEIAEHEGIVPAPYLDSVGILTFGIGHTANAGGLNPAELKRAMPWGDLLERRIDLAIDIFQDDIVKYSERVNKAIKVQLTQYQFDALVSFDFNTGGIYSAKLTKAINSRDPKAAKHFMGWLKPPEIRKRRTAEMNLFKTGDYDANGDSIPIWKTNGQAKLIGIHSEMSGAQLLKRMTGPEGPGPHVFAKAGEPKDDWLSKFFTELLQYFSKRKGL